MEARGRDAISLIVSFPGSCKRLEGLGMRPHPHLFHEVSLGGAIAIEHVVCVDQPTSQVHLDRGREARRKRHKGRVEGGMRNDVTVCAYCNNWAPRNQAVSVITNWMVRKAWE